MPRTKRPVDFAFVCCLNLELNPESKGGTMEVTFYLSGAIAIAATLMVIMG